MLSATFWRQRVSLNLILVLHYHGTFCMPLVQNASIETCLEVSIVEFYTTTILEPRRIITTSQSSEKGLIHHPPALSISPA